MRTAETDLLILTPENLFYAPIPIGAFTCPTGNEMLFFTQDLSRLTVLSSIPGKPTTIKRYVLGLNSPNQFKITHAASNGSVHLLCGSPRRLVLFIDGALKTIGAETHGRESNPEDGGAAFATFGHLTAVASTNRPEVLFYALERRSIRSVTLNSVSTVPFKASPTGALPSDWPSNLTSIVVGKRGEIYVSDHHLCVVAIIEHGEASLFQQCNSAPLSLTLSQGILYVLHENGTITSNLTPASLHVGKPFLSKDVVLTTSGLPYKPVSRHTQSSGTFPMELWSVIAQWLCNSEICRLRCLHPRLSRLTALRLDFTLQLPASFNDQDAFPRVFDQRMEILLPHLKDFTIGSTISSSKSQVRLPEMHLPASLPSFSTWPRSLERLVIELPLNYNSSTSLFHGLQDSTAHLHTLELYNTTAFSPFFLQSLPHSLTRLSLPHLVQAFALSILPPGLTYLDLSSAELNADSILYRKTPKGEPKPPKHHQHHDSFELEVTPPAAMLETLTTLIISSSLLTVDSCRALPPNITHLGVEKAEWLQGDCVAALPRSIVRLDARQALHFSDTCAALLPPHLTSLNLGRNIIITNMFIQQLSERCYELEELDVTHSPYITAYALPHLSELPRLRKLSLPIQLTRDLKWEHLSYLPRTMTELDLTDCAGLEPPMPQALSHLSAPLTPTTESGISKLDPFSKSEVYIWPPSLTKLKLGYTKHFPEAAFLALPQGLTFLSMKHCQAVDASGLAKLGRVLPRLTYLNLKYVRSPLDLQFISGLPRSLQQLVLPLPAQELLLPSNFWTYSSLPLTEIKLHHPRLRLTSSIFSLLPATLQLFSFVSLASVDESHWKYLPTDLITLSLPEVTNAEDGGLRQLPRLLEFLDLSSSLKATPLGISELRRLRTVSLGMDAQTLINELSAKYRDPEERAVEAANLINKLPRSLTSISLPLYFMDTRAYIIDKLSFVNYPQLRYLNIGKAASYIKPQSQTLQPAPGKLSTTEVAQSLGRDGPR